MKKFLGILIITFLSSAAFCQSDKETEVWARVEALNKAVFETKDSAAIQDLVSNEVTYGHSTGIIEIKSVMLHNAIVNAQVYKNLLAERSGAIMVGKTVIVRYILRASVIKDGNISPLNIGILQVWAKDRGKWRLFARQAVKVDPKL